MQLITMFLCLFCTVVVAQESINSGDNNASQDNQLDTKPIIGNPQQIYAKTNLPGKKLWNLKGADLRAVISEVSNFTGKNFVIDPRVQGKISVVSSKPMSPKELYQVFLAMLQVSGYAAIPNGAAINIIPSIEAKAQAPDLLSQLRSPPHGDDIMVAVIPVTYVPAEQLVPVLRPLIPQWSSVSAYMPSNMLILSGRANNIKQLTNIIKQVDSSSSNGIDLIPLRHTLAMDVVNTLKDLVKTPGPMNHVPTTIAADDRNNSILLSGSKTERIRLRLIIAKLDKPGAFSNSSNTQVVYLNYLRAEDLVPILAGVAQANFSGNVGTTIGTITRPDLDSTNPAANIVAFNNQGNMQNKTNTAGVPTTAGASYNPSATPNTSGAATQNEGSTKPSVQIIAEPNTNSVILNAPINIIRILKAVINQIDIRPAQLLIEALVAEIDQRDFNNLGIEWGSNLQTRTPTGFSSGFAIINSKTSLSDFQAQIYALAAKNKANILSTPSVIVLDNRQAKILVGRQVSIATTSYPNNAGGTTAGGSPFTTFDRVNVALHLYVRPQITHGQGIQLQIDQGHDTIEPTRGGIRNDNPIFRISSIVTSVQVDNGDIVVLGGLTQNRLDNNSNGLPILGEIPGLSYLFQRQDTNREKRVLMVFIRTLILHNERDTISISGSKYNDIRQSQLDWLRAQDYAEQNREILLPPLAEAILPRPFNGPMYQQIG